MPPEQAGGKSVDKRADVYAIGAILYHLLAGSPPYEGNTSKEILAKVLTDEPVSLETRVSGVPRDLATIVRKAMSRDCNARYPTAKELSSDLKSFQTGQLVSAYHYTTFALFRRWFRKYRLPVSLSASFLLLLGALSIASIRSIVRARNNAEAQRIAAVRERILAETRGDQLLLSAASSALGRDPTEALAWLKLYPRVDKNEERVRDIAADAVSRGVARHVLSHDQAVTTAHFSPDSKYLVSASAIGPVRIWSTETGKKIAELHTARSVYAARFTPDGTTVAFAGADNAITLWKWQTNQTQQLNGHQGSVRHLAFSNGGRLVSGAWDNTVRLWDPATGSSQVLAVHSGAVSSLSVSHDGNIVASAGVTASLSIKRLRPGCCEAFRQYKGKITSLAFSSDDRYLYAFTETGQVHLWELRSLREKVLQVHQGAALIGTVSSDGRFRASGGADSSVRLWDRQARRMRMLLGHQGAVRALAFSPDGKLLASGGTDGALAIWNTETGQSQFARGHSGALESIDFSADGKWIATVSNDRTVRIWAADYLLPGKVLSGHSDRTFHAVFSPDGTTLATDSRDATIRLWNLKTNAPMILRGHRGMVYGIAFSSDGQQLVSTGHDGTVRVWDTQRGTARVFNMYPAIPRSPAFSADGETVLFAGSDGDVRLWNWEKGSSIVIQSHRGEARVAAYSPDFKLIASGGNDALVQIQDVKSSAIRSIRVSQPVHAMTFSPDSKQLLVVSIRSLSLCSVDTSDCKALEESAGYITAFGFTRFGTLLASGGDEAVIRLRQTRSTEVDDILRGHSGAVRRLSFSNEDDLLASASQDGTARIWRIGVGLIRILRGHTDEVTSAAFSPSGDMIATTSYDSSVRLWPTRAPVDVPDRPENIRAWLDKVTTSTLPRTLGSSTIIVSDAAAKEQRTP